MGLENDSRALEGRYNSDSNNRQTSDLDGSEYESNKSKLYSEEIRSKIEKLLLNEDGKFLRAEYRGPEEPDRFIGSWAGK